MSRGSTQQPSPSARLGGARPVGVKRLGCALVVAAALALGLSVVPSAGLAASPQPAERPQAAANSSIPVATQATEPSFRDHKVRAAKTARTALYFPGWEITIPAGRALWGIRVESLPSHGTLKLVRSSKINPGERDVIAPRDVVHPEIQNIAAREILTFVPGDTFTGRDTFTFRVIDRSPSSYSKGIVSSGLYTLTLASDSVPSFAGGTSISSLSLSQGTPFAGVTLPAASGGDGTIAYSVSPDLPSGLSFDASTRRLSGTPTAFAARSSFTYSATDNDNDTSDDASDTATLGFTIEIAAATPTSPTLTTNVGSGFVILNFTGSGPHVTGWEYAQSTRSGTVGPWQPIAGSDSSTDRHLVSGLANFVTYYFRVRATNGVGNAIKGAPSVQVAARPDPARAVPGAVRNFRAAVESPTSVRLTWSPPALGGDVDRYEFRVKSGNGSYGNWLPVPGSVPTTSTYTVERLTSGTPYTFRVRAVNIYGPGLESIEASATPGSPPPVVTPPLQVPQVPTPDAALCPPGLPSAGFTDIDGYPPESRNAINCMAWYGLTKGTTPTTFSPNRQLTKSQLVLFLERLVTIVTAAKIDFQASTHAELVDAAATRLWALSVFPSATYASGSRTVEGVNRGELALRLQTTLEALGTDFGDSPINPFNDMGGADSLVRIAAMQLAERGVMIGAAPGFFEPEEPVTRAQAMLMLVRILTLPEIASRPLLFL